MRCKVNHDSMFAVGYFTSLSVHAGSVLDFHASSICPRPEISVVALDRQAPAAGCTVTRLGDLSVGEFGRGSWLDVDVEQASGPWSLHFAFELRTWDERCLVAVGPWQLVLGVDGQVRSVWAGVESLGPPLPLRRWIAASLTCDGAGLLVSLAVADGERFSFPVIGAAIEGDRVVIGTNLDASIPSLNAKIAEVVYCNPAGRSAWPFGLKPSLGVADQAGLRGQLRVHGAPTFSVTGPEWDGTLLDPRLAPGHYACVQLHDDDQPPFDWPASLRIEVAEHVVPGVYGLTLRHGAEVETFPFVVRARRPTARIVFLLPTLTYQAYANEALPEALYPWLADDRGHRFAQANGWSSLYDRHRDGSGVSWTSWPKPWTTLRPDYIYPLCGGPHGFPLDLHALQFLARQGVEVDVITDHDLDKEGGAALASGQALFTGSHPEYWTRAMHAALPGFLARGGSLAYLGGNGFYWAGALGEQGLEVRRGVSGTRTWEDAPGESHLALNGEPGGLWRWRGKPEHRITGIGSTGMGFSHALPYRRLVDSHAADVAWLFAGVGPDTFDAPGLLLGGPAGYEVDRLSRKWGIPDGTRLLAEAGPFEGDYAWPDGELYDAAEDHRIVAHMTLRFTPAGGIVFAVGSVAWLGALPVAGEENDVGRIMGNLIDFILAVQSLH